MEGQVRKKKRKPYNEFLMNLPTDYTVIFIVLFLTVLGIVMVYSSSFYTVSGGGWSEPYLRQSVYALIGLVLMWLLSRFQLVFINRFVGIGYVATLGLLMGVILVGESIKGAKRWIPIGGFNLQPSELSKFILILTLGFLLTKFKKHLANGKVLAILLIVTAGPVGLIAKEDLSSGFVVAVICGSMIFVAYRDTIRMLFFGIFMAGLGSFFIFRIGYRVQRIQTFLDGPWKDPQGTGRQTIQALYAIGSGGLTGIGLGQSIQKVGYISEAHNDIIFAIICEELGLFGGIAIVCLYGILLYRIAQIALEARSMNHFLVGIGVLVHIGIQAFINIGVALALLPVTGMGLPFISYGGSSLIIFFMEIGLVLNISRHNRVENHLGGNVYE